MSEEESGPAAWRTQATPTWPAKKSARPLAGSCLLAAAVAGGVAFLGWRYDSQTHAWTYWED